MTFRGTDVIVMPASRSRFTSGDAVDVVGGNTVSLVVGTVEKAGVAAAGIDGLMETTDGTVMSGAPDGDGDISRVAMLATHKVVRNTKTTSHRPKCRNGRDFTPSPQGTVSAVMLRGSATVGVDDLQAIRSL
jgi:hypothetical protein